MPFGLTTVEYYAAAGVAIVLVVAFGVAAWRAFVPDVKEYPPRNEDGELPEEVDLQPPRMKGSSFGMVGQVWKTWRYLRKCEKLAAKGYVQWYFIEDSFPTPKFIKPKDPGAGEREYEYKGGTYLFPKSGRLPDAETGLWTFVHARGEPRPVDISDPAWPGMSAEALKEYGTMKVTSSPPGLLDKLGGVNDPIKVALAIGIGAALLIGALQGGI